MKSTQLLHLFCAVLFLCETNGANVVSAQTKQSQPKKNSSPKTTGLVAAQKPSINIPKVTQIDFAGLQAVLKQNAVNQRPLLVNFWATWCPPCREEFPALVKIDAEYRAKGLEFVTVSLDDLAEIERDVPAFLAEMKATMPTYLLKTIDEEAAIHAIAPEWRGALPLTILYDASGKAVYTKMGLVKSDVLQAQIEKVLVGASGIVNQQIIKLKALEFRSTPEQLFQEGKRDAERDIAAGKLIVIE